MRRLSLVIGLFAITISLLLLNMPVAHAQDGPHTILVNGTERTYLIHLPSGYNDQEKVPLVIALHGGGGNPEQFARDTGFNQKADEAGFIVVYPRGTGLLPTWNAIHCCGDAFNNH